MQSTALAEANPPISIFYVSTYSNGFVFVGIDDIDRAVAVLKTQFPRVVQEQFVILPDPQDVDQDPDGVRGREDKGGKGKNEEEEVVGAAGVAIDTSEVRDDAGSGSGGGGDMEEEEAAAQ
jgi:hypothetical protein